MSQEMINAIDRCMYEEAIAKTAAARNYWLRKAEEIEYLAYITTNRPGRA